MSESLVWWMLVAVLVFWAMGAYNRLIRLRAQSLNAFLALDELFKQHIALIRLHVPDPIQSQDLPDAEVTRESFMNAWGDLAAASEQLSCALKQVQPHPLNSHGLGALKTSFENVAFSYQQLRDQSVNLASPVLPDDLPLQWINLTLATEMARNDFNGKVSDYNVAISQFPALLLARGFGFKPVTLI